MSLTVYCHAVEDEIELDIETAAKAEVMILSFDKNHSVFITERQLRKLADILERHFNKEVA